jgi:hypothetical protein
MMGWNYNRENGERGEREESKKHTVNKVLFKKKLRVSNTSSLPYY